jgi:hypothetical protein
MDLNTDTARGMVANMVTDMDTNTLREIDMDMDFKDSNMIYR